MFSKDRLDVKPHLRAFLMKIVIFHRAPQPQRAMPKNPPAWLDPWRQTVNCQFQNIEAIQDALLRPFSDRQITVLQPEDDLMHIEYRFRFFRKAHEFTIEVPLPQWSYFSFWFRPGVRRIDVLNEDFNRQNAMFASLLHEFADVAGAIGRVLILDDTALLYMRGLIPDIAGYENVTVLPGEHSTWAFARYSAKAEMFLEEIQRKRDATQTYSLPDKVDRLEKEIEELKKQLKSDQGSL